ncbi:MAG: methylated-DNA--[protein]-cysteine S-methyltransferase [Acetatifactor sp.]|nr:methylated-DNA--[protein]-cysteine S-methyltransferase [Acetatifactor sp.]
MQYTMTVQSPLGEILLAADDIGLTGLWFAGAKYYGRGLGCGCEEKNVPVFEETRRWLDIYFSGREPDFALSLHLTGTPFQLDVWKILCRIPYGETTTYGRIAGMIAEERGLPGMSAQAVGGAVGHNPVSVIVPCHRVVGADGSLTGYAGGIDRKIKLLMLEGRII